MVTKLLDKVLDKSITKKNSREIYKSIRHENVSRAPRNTLLEEKKNFLIKKQLNNLLTANLKKL